MLLLRKDNPLSFTSCHWFQSYSQSLEGKLLEHIFQWSVCIIHSVAIKHILEDRAIITNVHNDILQPLMQKITAAMHAQALLV